MNNLFDWIFTVISEVTSILPREQLNLFLGNNYDLFAENLTNPSRAYVLTNKSASWEHYVLGWNKIMLNKQDLSLINSF